MTKDDHNWDEDERFDTLFSAANHDALPPDAEFLQRLRTRSTEVFLDQFQSSAKPEVSERRSRKMLFLTPRAWAAAAAAVVLIASWFAMQPGEETDKTLNVVLTRLTDAQSLHLTLVRAGQPSDVWVAKPNRLRWNRPDGTYQIDDGQQLWDINEQENQAVPQASQYFGGDKPRLELLQLLDVARPQDQAAVLAQQPADQVTEDGVVCDVYQWTARSTGGPIEVKAIVAASDQMLRSLRTFVLREGRLEPVNELVVKAVNAPVDESLFKVASTLTVDGRIGKVTDCQGLVSVKPVAHARWTPIAQHTVLKPRDWIRTDLRGAHAAALRLATSIRVKFGPGTLVELEAPQRIKLVSGELKVVTDPEEPLTLLGPDNATITVRGTGLYRVDQDKIVALKSAPGWIAGFEGTSTQEAIGSLVAKIDGRDVPLTVGFHTVTVDIRDQIARTVIDESFVNHTPTQLEGVFYFPLPADASISGFGMWIGDEYVEADIVEKQRAREIYETILREKRDPGLLEWTGGNMFKARVFPILGNSEKRIRISYTQVLPRTGDRYRYSYALQSELLRQHPLRELGIDVKISSAVPISAVTSPTHPTRIDKTENSARVEFTAQEYTPTRDFEVVVELGQGKPLTSAPLPSGSGEGAASADQGLVMIPHQRGEDGYFMLQVIPPTTPAESSPREVLPDGEPLKLVVLADTSRSIDAASRTAQSEFVAALLSSLSPKDEFNLGTCDVDCQWAFDTLVPAEEGNVQSAREALDGRVSLGWTDLDKAFESALQQAGTDAQVLYIGDGIVTTGDADAVEFTKRLQRLYEGHQAKMHAVATSSRYEAAVLKSIATLGDGSLHRITGELGPVAVARQLLAELTQPSTRILKVEFPGLQTARVYPQDFPRLPAGAQQIVLGRYLPGADKTECEAVVTAQRGTETFELRAPVSLKSAEGDESFIPRLWARMHVDALLEQGGSQAVQDEIIALSEEYHIITPYTSLLVLETDADRERFKVQRRFQMRDAELFFAEGREKVDYDLLQQQMRQAGDWRIRLRMAVLRELSTLGREVEQERYQWFEANGRFAGGRWERGGGMGGGMGGVQGIVQDGSVPWHFGYSANRSLAIGEPFSAPMAGSGPWDVEYERLSESKPLSRGDAANGFTPNFALNFDGKSKYPAGPGQPYSGLDMDALGTDEFSRAEMLTEVYDVSGLVRAADTDLAVVSLRSSSPESVSRALSQIVGNRPMSGSGRLRFAAGVESDAGYALGEYVVGKRVYETAPAGKPQPLFAGSSRRWAAEQGQTPSWLGTLFPYVPPAPTPTQPTKQDSDWPAEARAVTESLLRTSQLAAIREGLEITRDVDYYQPRWSTLTSHQSTTTLISPERWLVCAIGDNTRTVVHTCDAQQREAFCRAFQLGRSRAATPEDLKQPPLDLAGYVLTSLEQSYWTYVPSLERQGDNAVVLTLTHPLNETSVFRFVIDTEKHVMLSMEAREHDEVTSSQKFGEFVEWGGAWWPTQIESFDAQGRRTSLTTQRFQLLGNDACAARIQELQAGRESVQFLREPLPDTRVAQKSIDDGKGTFEDHLAMIAHFYAIQKWDRVQQHFAAFESLAKDKPGMRWVRDAVLIDTRGREEVRQRIIERAAELAQTPAGEAGPDRFHLASHLWSQASNVFEANELLALLDTLKPVFDAQPPHLQAGKQWRQYRINHLSQTGQDNQVLELKKQLAVDYPHDAGLQQQYAQALMQVRDYDAAKTWVDGVLHGDVQWDTGEVESLRSVITQLYREQDRYEDLATYLAQWVAMNPEGAAAYQQYLSALIKSDRIEDATPLVDQWLEEGLQAERLPKPVAARLTAAVQLALGEGFELRTDRLDPRWWEPLAKVVTFHAQQDTLPDCTNQIMANSRFHETQQYQRVRRELVQLLSDKVATLRIGHVQRLIDWVWDCEVEKNVWPAIAESLRKRWDAEPQRERKHVLGQLLAHVLQGKIGTDEHLQFLRLQLEQGPKQYRTSYASALLQALSGGPWSAEREDEAFTLLPRLSDADNEADKLAPQISALQQLTDSMVQSRFQALMSQVTNQSELTRTELRDKQLENMKQARTQYANRLKERMRGASESLVPWMNAEWTYLQMLLNENLDEVEQRCWEALGTAPPKIDTGSATGDALQEALLWRFMMTVTNLGARREARPELVERLIAYVDQGIGAKDETSDAWKQHKFRLLVALDRSDELAAALGEWIKADDAMASTWQMSLAYLLAEQGKLAEAIEWFEILLAKDQLAAGDLKALADWYMVLNKRDAYQKARRASFNMTEEWQLRDALAGQVERWERLMNQGDVSNPFGGPAPVSRIPTEVDDDVLQIFAALFAKSSEPANYVDLLRQYYRATHDFRLLTGLADAVTGQTAGKVYPWLKNARNVISEVREEATVDSLVAHLPQVRALAESAVDQRALDLVELMLERRAAELLNQPGPHAQRALEALQRAFKREWSEGEPRLMADYLAYLGQISDVALAQEQTRQLESLHQQSEAGTVDSLEIGHRLASLYWSYDRKTDATDLLEAALQEHQSARGGVLPTYANDALSTYVAYLDQRGLHVQAQRVLLEQLKHPANAQQTIWLQQKLAEVYEDALARGGEVSLGKGVALYKAQVDRLVGELQHADKKYCRACIDRLVSVYSTAHNKQIITARQDLVAFARERLPDALKRQINEYQGIVGSVADAIHNLAGPRAGLAFLIDTLNREPRWFAYERRDGWNEHGWRLCYWRKEVEEQAEKVGKLGDLEQPLLAIVTRELRRDLETRQQRNRNMYWQYHNDLFWESQRDAFLRTAETVYAQYKDSPPTVKAVAEYVAVGLENYGRGIEMLLAALQDGTLDEDGRDKLVTWLHHENRYAESVPLLQEMIEKWPDNMTYRVYLMRALFHTKRSAELSALVDQTDAYFHEKKRWNEEILAPLGATCVECALFERAVKYYNELIPLCKRTRPNAGIGEGVLSGYCSQLARAYAGLGKTAEAVDAACEAIVSWGPRQQQRQEAINALTQVLREARELSPYVESLDRAAEETGSDKPIVRKALGIAFATKQQWANAITQFKLAIQLQPNDPETHTKLIECYDALGDKQAAIYQTLAALEINPRNIELCKALGKRYSDVGRTPDIERAYTSIIELLPNEAEGHAMLAEIRQEQDRWPDAARHWQQVASIRRLEPTGLLRLAGAQIHLQQWDAAKETIAKLRSQTWPDRFRNVQAEIRELEAKTGDR